MGALEMSLSYHFEPGSARDGATLTVPLYALNQVDAVRCEWLVPGMLKEKAHLLLKSLPQKLRRHCVRCPSMRRALSNDGARARISKTAFTMRTHRWADRCADTGRARAPGVAAAPVDFKLESCPASDDEFQGRGPAGRQLAMGRNLASLQAELGAQGRSSSSRWPTPRRRPGRQAQQPITDWTSARSSVSG